MLLIIQYKGLQWSLPSCSIATQYFLQQRSDIQELWPPFILPEQQSCGHIYESKQGHERGKPLILTIRSWFQVSLLGEVLVPSGDFTCHCRKSAGVTRNNNIVSVPVYTGSAKRYAAIFNVMNYTCVCDVLKCPL